MTTSSFFELLQVAVRVRSIIIWRGDNRCECYKKLYCPDILGSRMIGKKLTRVNEFVLDRTFEDLRLWRFDHWAWFWSPIYRIKGKAWQRVHGYR